MRAYERIFGRYIRSWAEMLSIIRTHLKRSQERTDLCAFQKSMRKRDFEKKTQNTHAHAIIHKHAQIHTYLHTQNQLRSCNTLVQKNVICKFSVKM